MRIPWTLIVVIAALAGLSALRLGGAPIPAPEGGDEEAAASAEMRRVLGRDSILPIYEPRLVDASRAPYQDDELVLGVSLRGESRAYDISTLNAREIVVDQLAGTPILATW